MAYLLDVEELAPGLIIYHRADVKHRQWYCRVKVPDIDRYKVVSLKTEEREAARKLAFKQYARVEFCLENDVPVFNRPFHEIAADYLKVQEERAAVGEITKDRAAVVGTAIRTLNLYVGHLQIDTIGQDKWDGYSRWRLKHGRRPSGWLNRKTGKLKLKPPKEPKAEEEKEGEKKKEPKPISTWTIRHEMIVFRSIMSYAASRKFIPHTHIPKGDPIKATERREEFTREEYRALHSRGRAWIRRADTERREWSREMTYLYALIMCNTGMRPPEGKNLLWRDVSFTTIDKDTRGKDQSKAEAKKAEQDRKAKEAKAAKKDNKQEADKKTEAAKKEQEKEYRRIVVLNVRGKGKNRRLVAPENVADFLERVRKIAKVKGPDDHVFSTYEGKRDTTVYARMVREMLIYAELLKGPAGTERSSYCFRHTYATLRLSEGVNDIMLAEQMGTDVQIIQDHYGHIHPVKNADRILIGMKTWEDPEPGEADKDAAGKDRVNKVEAAAQSAKGRSRKQARMN
ncbi:MAG: site-specific integrase [Rhizomicrobium sp.]|jgi:integrase